MNEAATVAAMQRALDGTGPPVSIPFAMISSWVDDFAAERRIGGGGFGDVYVGVVRDTASQTYVGVAVKKLLPVRLQGPELEEWKHDSVVRVSRERERDSRQSVCVCVCLCVCTSVCVLVCVY
jgi:hypothetical protein